MAELFIVSVFPSFVLAPPCLFCSSRVHTPRATLLRYATDAAADALGGRAGGMFGREGLWYGVLEGGREVALRNPERICSMERYSDGLADVPSVPSSSYIDL